MEDGLVDISGTFYLVSKGNKVYVITLFVCQSQTNMFWDINSLGTDIVFLACYFA